MVRRMSASASRSPSHFIGPAEASQLEPETGETSETDERRAGLGRGKGEKCTRRLQPASLSMLRLKPEATKIRRCRDNAVSLCPRNPGGRRGGVAMGNGSWDNAGMNILALASVVILVAAASGPKDKLPPVETVKEVDLARYMGKWFEIAAFPQRFQKGCHCTTAEYELTAKGTVQGRQHLPPGRGGRQSLAGHAERLGSSRGAATPGSRSNSSGHSRAIIGSSILPGITASPSSGTRPASISGSCPGRRPWTRPFTRRSSRARPPKVSTRAVSS